MHGLSSSYRARPTRAAGLARLDAFLPFAAHGYAEGRNTDPGPGAPAAVSRLSPYIRCRLLTEAEITRRVIAMHGPVRARKFIEEVIWRSYWKGWLEQRPSVFAWYRAGVVRAENRLATEAGLRRAFHAACEGETGIACFDSWARELVTHNYLHNHARMWFASIWIFTLRLPWELGAEFFLRHLLDGDAASNTLSWRWVAGLHTRGKPYVARAANIARHTEGRFDPRGELDEDPAPLTEEMALPKPAMPGLAMSAPERLPAGPVALLLHDEDCAPESLDLGPAKVAALAGISAAGARAARGTVPAVAEFAAGAVADALARAAFRFDVEGSLIESPENLAAWARGHGLPVVTPYPPVGPVADLLARSDFAPIRVLRRWDADLWPHATRGYFQLRARIPDLLDSLEAA